MIMDKPITLLLTSPSETLLADIARNQPDWRVVTLDDRPPAEPLTGKGWAFVDWLCPNLSGLELCRRLREAPTTRQAHITMVMDAFNGDACRRALAAGADDYVVGPLDLARLRDRITPNHNSRDAASYTSAPIPAPSLPAAAPRQDQQLVLGKLIVDLSAHRARIGEITIPLRPNEFRLLVFFLQNANRVHSRAALIAALWKDDSDIDERTIDVWVGRLRRALVSRGAADPIRTVRFMGYVLDSAS
ncbi:MAG: hypothetical protein RLZZ136_84 [Pseudomonadota bacterium]|jgi:two-component system phosphate regulon response regulator PhoB